MAEVDFTRHVLICKLQRLENKLEESLSTIDYNNNNTLTDEKGRSIEEIRDEMSKDYRDLRKLLQETSTQLKQVLDEKPPLGVNEENENDGQGKILRNRHISENIVKFNHDLYVSGCIQVFEVWIYILRVTLQTL